MIGRIKVLRGAVAGVLALLCAGMAQQTLAQDYSALLNTSDTLSGQRYDSPATQIPAFTVLLPLAAAPAPEFVTRIDSAPLRGLVSVTFATPDGALIEAVNLARATIPLGPIDARLEQFATLVNNQTLPYLLQRFEQGRSTGLRPITIGNYRAIELLGSSVHPSFGPVSWRLVGLLNPDSPDCLIALVQVASAQLPLPSVESFEQTLTGRLLASLRFAP